MPVIPVLGQGREVGGGRVSMNQNPKPVRSAYRPCLGVRGWWESYTRQERTKYNLMVIKINKNLKLHFNWINLSDMVTGTNYCGQTMKWTTGSLSREAKQCWLASSTGIHSTAGREVQCWERETQGPHQVTTSCLLWSAINSTWNTLNYIYIKTKWKLNFWEIPQGTN